MTFTSLKAALNICLMIALVSMQLSSAHIHVAEHHQHDGSHHAHVSKAHSHALSDHHSDAFENTSTSASNLVVEMAQEAIVQINQPLDDHPLAPYQTHHPLTPNTLRVKLAFQRGNHYQASWLRYSNVRLRAPPVFLA